MLKFSGKFPFAPRLITMNAQRHLFWFELSIKLEIVEIIFHCPSKRYSPASAGNRTRVNCLEGSYAHHYTTDASLVK